VAQRLSAAGKWIVDPIDGTKNFVRGGAGLGQFDRVCSKTGRSFGGWCGQRARANTDDGGPRAGQGAFVSVDGAMGAPAVCVLGGRVGCGGSLSFSSLSGWVHLGLREKIHRADRRRVGRVRRLRLDFLSYLPAGRGGGRQSPAEPEVCRLWDPGGAGHPGA